MLLGSLLVVSVRADSLLEAMDREVSALCAKSKDAIVKVHAHRPANSGGPVLGPVHRVGTGFFIDGEGRLMTSASVVAEATNCWVEWRGEEVPARVLGRDPLTNLALLQVERRTPFLTAGNDSELRVGSMVIVIGFPYDQPSEPSVGFVTGSDIRCGGHNFPTSHLRAGCRLRPGQGGGPVLNHRGEVVGMAVAAHQQDQCYILPFHAAQKVARDIQKTGAPQHGWIGLSVSEQATTGTAWLVTVQQTYSNTPAASAGFRSGDVLLAIHTNQIRSAADILNHAFQHRRGDKLEFTILREGQRQQLTLTVAERPADDAEPQLPSALPGATRPRLILTPASGSRNPNQ